MSRANLLIVPCHNEAARFDAAAWHRLLDADRQLGLLLVDDGSNDGTAAMLRALADARPQAVEVLSLHSNRGKGEAVRHGLLAALERGASIVGYADADMAVPPEELLCMLDAFRVRPEAVLLGSRVQMLGTRIERSPWRHYSGRVFATAASLALRMPVYDTQCGAKWFRGSPPLRAALAQPFRSRWIFDVELLGRLRRGTDHVPGLAMDAFREWPLAAWRDVPGSRFTLLQKLRAAWDLLRLVRLRGG